MDIMDYVDDMPLVSVLMFRMQAALPKHAEDMVDELLTQVHNLDK